MTIKITKDGGAALSGDSNSAVIAALAKQGAQAAVAAVAAFTDNGGGTDGGVVVYSAPVANVADGGTTLAQKAASEAAAATVKDALQEVATKTNEYLTALGLPTLTVSIGGTSADGTIGAVTQAVTAATTGIQASNANTYIAAVNTLLASLAAKVNACSRALGYDEVTPTVRSGATAPAPVTTLPALTANALGTAADPGVSKAAFDAVLDEQANSIKALSVALDRLTAARAPLVLIG